MAEDKKEQRKVKELEKKMDSFLSSYLLKDSKNVDGKIQTPRYETGILLLDALTGGGFPKGHFISIGAEPGVGKTTVIVHACGDIARKYPERNIYYIDIEGGATPELLSSMGFLDVLYTEDNPTGNFYLIKGMQTIQEIAKLLKMVKELDNASIVVIDSDTMVADQIALDKDDLGTSNEAIGANARMWSKNANTLLATVRNSEMCVILVHQARTAFKSGGFIATVESAGGNAAKHLSSVDIWGSRAGWIGQDNDLINKRAEAVGCLINLTTIKNRLTTPFKRVQIPIYFGKGVDNSWAYEGWLQAHGDTDPVTGEFIPYLEVKGGGYNTFYLPFAYGEKVRGSQAVMDFIKENEEAITEFIKNQGSLEAEAASEDEITEDIVGVKPSEE